VLGGDNRRQIDGENVRDASEELGSGSLLSSQVSRAPSFHMTNTYWPITASEEWGEDEDWGGEDEWGEDDDWGGGDDGGGGEDN